MRIKENLDIIEVSRKKEREAEEEIFKIFNVPEEKIKYMINIENFIDRKFQIGNFKYGNLKMYNERNEEIEKDCLCANDDDIYIYEDYILIHYLIDHDECSHSYTAIFSEKNNKGKPIKEILDEYKKKHIFEMQKDSCKTNYGEYNSRERELLILADKRLSKEEKQELLDIISIIKVEYVFDIENNAVNKVCEITGKLNEEIFQTFKLKGFVSFNMNDSHEHILQRLNTGRFVIVKLW